MTTISFTYEDDDGEEIEASLPAKMEVCYRCSGHGSHLHPAIGEHAYSVEEFYESFSEPEDREEYFRHGGIYDVACEVCHGQNVIPVVDGEACHSDEQKKLLVIYGKKLEDDYQYERERRAE